MCFYENEMELQKIEQELLSSRVKILAYLSACEISSGLSLSKKKCMTSKKKKVKQNMKICLIFKKNGKNTSLYIAVTASTNWLNRGKANFDSTKSIQHLNPLTGLNSLTLS